MPDSGGNGIIFRGVRGVALPVLDEARAKNFYGEILNLPVAVQAGAPIGFLLGETILMLKEDASAPPSADPFPRVTLEVDDARAMERELRQQKVVISDDTAWYGASYIGSFLDSEGNKLWFCSYA